MKKSVFLLTVIAMLLSARVARAQTVLAEAKDQPGSPVTITSAQCIPASDGGSSCIAKFRVGPSDIVAIGYKWTLTYPDGSAITVRGLMDGGPTGNTPFKAGEEADTGGTSGGLKSKDGKPQIPVKAGVQLEFVVPAAGKSWGNLQSPTYWQMQGQRQGYRQALIRLRSVYSKDGLPGLLKELDRPGTAPCCSQPPPPAQRK